MSLTIQTSPPSYMQPGLSAHHQQQQQQHSPLSPYPSASQTGPLVSSVSAGGSSSGGGGGSSGPRSGPSRPSGPQSSLPPSQQQSAQPQPNGRRVMSTGQLPPPAPPPQQPQHASQASQEQAYGYSNGNIPYSPQHQHQPPSNPMAGKGQQYLGRTPGEQQQLSLSNPNTSRPQGQSQQQQRPYPPSQQQQQQQQQQAAAFQAARDQQMARTNGNPSQHQPSPGSYAPSGRPQMIVVGNPLGTNGGPYPQASYPPPSSNPTHHAQLGPVPHGTPHNPGMGPHPVHPQTAHRQPPPQPQPQPPSQHMSPMSNAHMSPSAHRPLSNSSIYSPSIQGGPGPHSEIGVLEVQTPSTVVTPGLNVVGFARQQAQPHAASPSIGIHQPGLVQVLRGPQQQQQQQQRLVQGIQPGMVPGGPTLVRSHPPQKGAGSSILARTEPPHGAAILRLLQYFSGFADGERRREYAYWKDHVDTYFIEEGIVHQSFRNTFTGEVKEFDLPTSVLPRYFLVAYQNSCRAITLNLENPRESRTVFSAQHGFRTITVDVSRASITYVYYDGTQVVTTGSLKAVLIYTPHGELAEGNIGGGGSGSLLLSRISFNALDFTEYIARSSIRKFPIYRPRLSIDTWANPNGGVANKLASGPDSIASSTSTTSTAAAAVTAVVAAAAASGAGSNDDSTQSGFNPQAPTPGQTPTPVASGPNSGKTETDEDGGTGAGSDDTVDAKEDATSASAGSTSTISTSKESKALEGKEDESVKTGENQKSVGFGSGTGPGGPSKVPGEKVNEPGLEAATPKVNSADLSPPEMEFVGESYSMPGPIVNEFGISLSMMRCLEISEQVVQMGPLMSFCKSENLGPKDGLKQLADRIRASHMLPQSSFFTPSPPSATGSDVPSGSSVLTPGRQVSRTPSQHSSKLPYNNPPQYSQHPHQYPHSHGQHQQHSVTPQVAMDENFLPPPPTPRSPTNPNFLDMPPGLAINGSDPSNEMSKSASVGPGGRPNLKRKNTAKSVGSVGSVGDHGDPESRPMSRIRTHAQSSSSVDS